MGVSLFSEWFTKDLHDKYTDSAFIRGFDRAGYIFEPKTCFVTLNFMLLIKFCVMKLICAHTLVSFLYCVQIA